MSEQGPGGGEPQYPYGDPHDPHGEPQYPYGGPPSGGQYGQPGFGEPQYGQPQYGQPQYGQPQYGQPPYGQPGVEVPGTTPRPGGGRALIWVAIAVLVVAALGIGGFLLLSDDSHSSASPGGPSTAAAPVVPIPSISIPSIAIPSISIPSIAIPSISIPSIPALPGGTTLTNPCSLAGAPAQAATIYVGLAEIGQAASAQACVYRSTVPASVTARIGAGQGSAHLYVPSSGSSGSVFTFTTVDGSGRLQVTITKEPDGKLYVTKVRLS